MYGMEATVVSYRQGVRKRGFIYRENGSFWVKVISGHFVSSNQNHSIIASS